MKVPCYICEVPTEIDDIVRHLRNHSDAESIKAYRKAGPKKKQGKVDVSGLGGTYVTLDKDKKDVVE
jgi:hypothetical protein